MLQADADEKVLAVEAQGKQALYEAENTLKTEQIELQKALAMLKILPELVEQAVKPLENIEGIKILQGYGQGSGAKGEHTVATSGNGLAEQVTQAALNYRANAPLVDSMLREVGLVDADKGSLADLVTGNSDILAKAGAVKPKPVMAASENLNGHTAQDSQPTE
jgi:uncharacterized membrane protein YqiK